MRARAAVSLALLIGCLLPPARALAHANLVRSDPPDLCGPLARPKLRADDPRCATGAVLTVAPTVIRLVFSEKAEPFAGGIAVISPSGRRVEQGTARAAGTQLSVGVDAAETGTYLVRWRVIATDTHPARGSFAFSVGQASAPPRAGSSSGGEGGAVSGTGLAMQAFARFIHLAGYALAFGALAFLLLVLRPAAIGAGRGETRLFRLVNVGVLLMLVAGLLALLAQTASLAGGQLFDPVALSDVLSFSFGRVLVQQIGAALLLWVLLGPIRQGTKAATVAAVLLGALLALADTEASHAIGRQAWLAVPATGVHISVMGLWAGGLLALLYLWRLPAFAARRGELSGRFGRIAAASLLLLVLTGTVMATLHLTGPGDLISTSYGRTLFVKLLLVAVVAVLAFAGRRGIRFRRERWWSLETLSIGAVVALAGLLVSLSPPR